MYKILFWGLAGLVIIGGGSFFLFGGNSADAGLDITAILPDEINLGIPFIIKVGVSNATGRVLEDAKAALLLPEGMAFLGSGTGKTVETKSLGRIGEGSVIQEDFEVIVTSGENAVKKPSVRVSYTPQGIKSQFEKIKEFELEVGAAGLSMEITAPENIVAGEDFAVNVSYKNTSDIDLKDLRLKIDYPAGFEFKKSDLDPDLSTNVWDLGDLRKGSENEFKITGNLIGPEKSKHDFRARVEAGFLGEVYQIAEKTASVGLVASPLSLQVLLNDSPESRVVVPSEELSYTIAYVNNGSQAYRNLIIKVQLRGEMFDFATIQSDGIVNPLGSPIVWNSATNPELAVITPDSSGAVEFRIRSLSTYPIKRLSDKNFVLKVDARAESSKTVAVSSLESKIRGNISVDAQAFFRDAAAGILNSGPIPPKVGAPTNYTVHWILKNYSSDVSDVSVRATLPSGVRFTNVTKTNAPTNVVYDESARIVSWRFDKLPATKGVVDKPMEAIFQIEATPGPEFINTYMPLIGETTITAKDDFTGSILSGSDVGLTTALPDDATVGGGGGVVIQ